MEFKSNSERDERYFLVSPLLASVGPYFSRMKDSSDVITSLGNPLVEVPGGTPQIVYDRKGFPYVFFVGSDPSKAKESAERLGLIIGDKKCFRKTDLKGLSEILGFWD
ncbi:MAG: hypothetical protein DRJ31_09110 [Candidatus Methanomethylicota archaeon]|uniref:Uncharacterized protein n=1 Tax=Thermoproteota archaeon TaxID=2056631 RepID=A0A497EK80_9CREN|nr:MAG: hypothetical protein DRJ31_09110 [Candidatus Verstraetearchaeota archaeon]